MKTLMAYTWPGNVRELSNVLERATVICNDDMIDVDDLPDKIKVIKEQSKRGLKDMLGYFEKKIISDTLASNKGNKEKAASQLGVDLATLYRKMKKLGIEAEKD
jgi:transcriptional regulator with PAS, ATPase and Fis domain